MAARIEVSNLSPDPMLREVWRAEHIFRELGRTYRFGVVSDLPALLRSPKHSVGLFACDFPMSAAMQTRFKALEARMLAMQPNPPASDGLLRMSDLVCIETMAHHTRQRAVREEASAARRAELFHTAYVLYRSLLYAMSYDPLTSIAKDLPARMAKRFTVVTPIPDLHLVAPELRRRVAHCFGGMALCALMGYENPMQCFGLASAAVCWEPARPLELVNLFRVHLLLFGRYRLGLVNLVDNGVGYESDRPDEVRARMLRPNWDALMRLPLVCVAFNQQQVLPAVLKHGTAAMLEREREIMGPADWVEVRGVCFVVWNGRFLPSPLCFQSLRLAESINQRVEDRQARRIPVPAANMCTRVVDGRFAERRCAGCAVWQADTDRKLERCSGCMTAYYCGRECQRKDWPAHKLVCGK
jgi:hypothetical protein